MYPQIESAEAVVQAPQIPKLEVRGVRKSFLSGRQEILALSAISLQVMSGEFVCLVGPSGCGKTTLLRMIAGLELPDQGEILVDGQTVSRPGQDRMVMFQEASLFPWLSALENVEFGLRLNPELSCRQCSEIAMQHLELVGLKDFAKSRIHELSGGMKQRVALARALAPNPRMLLMDEPFAALDAMTREQLYSDLQRIWAERGKTILLVTHNVREAACLADRVILFSPRPGRLCGEHQVTLARPRDINNPRLAEAASQIRHGLRAQVRTEGVR